MGNACVNPKSYSAARTNNINNVRGQKSVEMKDGVKSSGRSKDARSLKTLVGFAKVANRSMEPKGVSESMVHFFEIVSQEHCDRRNVVRAGCLLRWMDICACLSAEKHGQLSSVTLSMDDLSFDIPAVLGDVLEISATVNNAFNTSMEVGVQVLSMSPNGPRIHCRAYFTFVSLDHHGVKCKVPKVIPETESERDNFILAKERRQLRFKKKEMIETLLSQVLSEGGEKGEDEIRGRAMTDNPEVVRAHPIKSQTSVKPKAWTGNRKRLSIMLREGFAEPIAPNSAHPERVVRSMTESMLQMTKVVLPSDANHMNNTFGGNIMSWMDDAATVCAIKHIRHPSMKPDTGLATIAVDSMAFLGPSMTGDRVTFFAQINRAFGTTLEVGIRVEAQALGGPMRHINSGYLTLMAVDSRGKPTAVPKIEPDTEKQKEQFLKAIGRRQLRMERKKLTGENKNTGLSWNWSDEMANEISIANIYGLLKVANAYDLPWKREELPKDVQANNIFDMKMEVTRDTWGLGVATVRISGVVSCKMSSMFTKIMDVANRKNWDVAIQESKVMKNVDEHNDVIWTAYPGKLSGKDAKSKDFCLYRSWRMDDDRYIVSSRSINHPSVPPTDDYVRGEVLPSGFILTPWIMDDGMTDWRDDTKQQQTSFDYVVQLDKTAQEMAGFGNPDSPYIKIMVKS
eukprot:CAMPEP_0197572560 /NCGR_PEP_ID=MMETSP1320-20131121/42521_1 /TAXON_ID=91990 /ORGANISM="Bolidomonas sp., Strain RCC2347" /LENGTH=681 /DNA_ID=CAMNT_0043135065 /DNA_START=245 /DNA_END=2287 /DNA_ORIENTATION=+